MVTINYQKVPNRLFFDDKGGIQHLLQSFNLQNRQQQIWQMFPQKSHLDLAISGRVHNSRSVASLIIQTTLTRLYLDDFT